jgi:hypothetical protein
MKKLLLLLSVSLITVSCTTQVLDEPPLQYSFMPDYMDVDSIGPEIPLEEVVIDSTLEDFKSIPLDEGTLVTGYDTVDIPAGVLISDKKAAEFVFYRSGYERQQVELNMARYLSREYYEKSLEAEKLYQQEIVNLREQAKRTWFEQNRGYIGFMAGILSCVLTGVVIVEITN